MTSPAQIRTSSNPISLYIMGCGIKGIHQLTTETRQALDACRSIHVLHDDPLVLHQLSRMGYEVCDLASAYDGYEQRDDAYRNISTRLVAEAESRPPVGFVVHGHPLFLVSATSYAKKAAEQRGLKTRVLPSVSSFDTVLCDLSLDLGYGVQIFDASTLVSLKKGPMPNYPALIFQLTSLLDTGIIKSHVPASKLQPLVDYLLNYYPPDHRVTVVQSATFHLERPELTEMTISALVDDSRMDLDARPTLYIPAI